ncbi:hypothetical protein EJ04DRAFT_563358 [Polyplosphaeria fusca]|uniref:Uncharacterized protein n=1 Tax=Polyplosphaeria fusca TaxID=682080 RepID=A0A9P4QX13_9PLEO|nr:hypothetical protein EJ04DRAFT_563358 [Polyplosphaeria fusca]
MAGASSVEGETALALAPVPAPVHDHHAMIGASSIKGETALVPLVKGHPPRGPVCVATEGNIAIAPTLLGQGHTRARAGTVISTKVGDCGIDHQVDGERALEPTVERTKNAVEGDVSSTIPVPPRASSAPAAPGITLPLQQDTQGQVLGPQRPPQSQGKEIASQRTSPLESPLSVELPQEGASDDLLRLDETGEFDDDLFTPIDEYQDDDDLPTPVNDHQEDDVDVELQKALAIDAASQAKPTNRAQETPTASHPAPSNPADDNYGIIERQSADIYSTAAGHSINFEVKELLELFYSKIPSVFWDLERIIQSVKGGDVFANNGFPLYDISERTTSVIFHFNPSGAHWAALEVFLTDPPRIFSYNPNQNKDENRRPVTKAALERLPLALHLAGLRPGSPLARYNWCAAPVQSLDCPRKCRRNMNCGFFIVYYIVARVNDMTFRPIDPDDDNNRFCVLFKNNYNRHDANPEQAALANALSGAFDDESEENAAIATIQDQILASVPNAEDDHLALSLSSLIYALEATPIGLPEIQSLYSVGGFENFARPNDTILSALLQNEPYARGAVQYVEPSRLEKRLDSTKDLDDRLAKLTADLAVAANATKRRWVELLLEYVAQTTPKCIFFYHPFTVTMVVEVFYQHKVASIRLFNPAQEVDHTLAAAMHELPLLMHLESKRTQSPFRYARWQDVQVDVVPCTQQSVFDSAVMAIHMVVLRLNNAKVPDEQVGPSQYRQSLAHYIRASVGSLQ